MRRRRRAAVRNGPRTAIPSKFNVQARLAEPPVDVWLRAVVDDGGYVRVWELRVQTIEQQRAGSITTGKLRELPGRPARQAGRERTGGSVDS